MKFTVDKVRYIYKVHNNVIAADEVKIQRSPCASIVGEPSVSALSEYKKVVQLCSLWGVFIWLLQLSVTYHLSGTLWCTCMHV